MGTKVTKLLLTCIGKRDPIDENDSAAKQSLSRLLAAPVERIWEVSSHKLHFGPILSALLCGHPWLPDEICLAADLSDEEMLGHYRKCVSALQRLGRFNVRPIDLSAVRVAQYDDAIPELERRVRLELNGRLLRNSEVRILLGPATPALNTAMALLSRTILPQASLYQILDPTKVAKHKPESVAVDDYAFRKVELDGVTVEGTGTQREMRLRLEVQSLEAEIARLKSDAFPPAMAGSAWSDNLREARELYDQHRRTVCARAVATELAAALSEGRQPEVQRAATLVGLERRHFAQILKRAGLDFPR